MAEGGNGSDRDTMRWAAAATWAQRPALTAARTVLLRAEQYDGAAGSGCLVIGLDRAPVWTRLRAAAEWATSLVPRLRQRIEEPVPALGATPRWVEDASFDLDRHLRRERLGAGAGDDLLAAARRISGTPFDLDRPLWEAVLLTGLPEGGAAFVLKVHPALADQLGAVQLLSLLGSRTRRHTKDKPLDAGAAGAGADSHEPSPGPSAASTAAPTVGQPVAPTDLIADLVRGGLFAARHPRTVVAESLRYAGSLRRLVSPPPAPASPLLDERDPAARTFLSLQVSAAALRDAGRRVGGSLQDAFTAAVLGGLRRYHEHYGTEIDALPVAIRVSLDRADDPMSGNRFAGAMIAGPAGITDPADRIAAVRGEVLSLHTERALDAFRALAPVANLLPTDLLAATLGLGAAADASVATIPGPGRTTYLAGAKVTSMTAFAPPAGTALAATLLVLGDDGCVGVTVDALAVPDLSVLRRCLEQGLTEVAALAE